MFWAVSRVGSTFWAVSRVDDTLWAVSRFGGIGSAISGHYGGIFSAVLQYTVVFFWRYVVFRFLAVTTSAVGGSYTIPQ